MIPHAFYRRPVNEHSRRRGFAYSLRLPCSPFIFGGSYVRLGFDLWPPNQAIGRSPH
jgi:hypothetical protein